jgi:hypothetical protein
LCLCEQAAARAETEDLRMRHALHSKWDSHSCLSHPFGTGKNACSTIVIASARKFADAPDQTPADFISARPLPVPIIKQTFVYRRGAEHG